MVWAPKDDVRLAVKFWLDCLQVITVAGAVMVAFISWSNYKAEQEKFRHEQAKEQLARQELEEKRHSEQQNRNKEQLEQQKQQTARASEQLAAVKRELQRPYQEKKLNLYLDAARVLAHLAATPNINQEATEARFWELYWGELPFVESKVSEERQGGPPSIEGLMVQFCHKYFGSQRCVKGGSRGPDKTGSPTGVQKLNAALGEVEAIDLSRHASDEIRSEWEKLGK